MDGEAGSGLQVTKTPTSPRDCDGVASSGAVQGACTPFPPFFSVGTDLCVSPVRRVALYSCEIFLLWLCMAMESTPFLSIWMWFFLGKNNLLQNLLWEGVIQRWALVLWKIDSGASLPQQPLFQNLVGFFFFLVVLLKIHQTWILQLRRPCLAAERHH